VLFHLILFWIGHPDGRVTSSGWVGVTELSAPNNKGVWKRIPAGAFANGHGLRKTPQVFDGLANQ